MPAMNTDQIRCFCAVVEHGGFTRAARRLFLSQSAVSQQVQALEQGLGLALLDRSRRPPALTEAGAAVYHLGTELLERVTAIYSAVDQLKGLHGGRVSLAAGIGPGEYVLPPLVARFRRQYPGIHIELVVVPTPQVFEHTLRGTVDLGIGLRYHVPEGLEARLLYRDAVVLVVGPRHHWARRGTQPLPVALLANQPLIAPGAHSVRVRQYYEERLREMGVEPTILLEFDTPEAVKRVVAAGEGVAFLSRSNVATEVDAGALRVVPVEGWNLHAEFVVVRRPRQYLSPAAKAFLDFLSAVFETDVHFPPSLPSS
jgi:DNA-binding transcriptional LysR family regulator